MKRAFPTRVAVVACLALAAGLLFAVPCASPERTRAPGSPSTEATPPGLPKVDVHVHAGPAHAERLAAILAEHGISIALDASGGSPAGSLPDAARMATQKGSRVLPYCSIPLSGIDEPRFATEVREGLTACRRMGAVGLKIGKYLGLGLLDAAGQRVPVDDRRLDVLFDTAGELELPVLIHSGDPQAFFRAPTPANERYEELSAHPGWSFWGDRPDGAGPWPSWQQVFEEYERRVARHPRTTFIGAHFGNAPEEPERVSKMLDRYDHLMIETGARIPEIGRHDPARIRALFLRHADRILFGTDLQIGDFGLVLGSAGRQPDPPSRLPEFFAAHFRYFETAGRHMPHPTPIQGRWTIDGLDLPESVLRKLYANNAVRVFRLAERFPEAYARLRRDPVPASGAGNDYSFPKGN